MASQTRSLLCQSVLLILMCFSMLLLVQVDGELVCDDVKDIYQQNGCCGNSETQVDQPTCGDLKGLISDCSGCFKPEPIWCNATNCTDVSLPTPPTPTVAESSTPTAQSSSSQPTMAPTAEPSSGPPTIPTPDPTTLVFADGTNNCSDTMSVHHYMSAEELEVQPVGFPFDVPGASAMFQLPQSTLDSLVTLLWVNADECSTALPVARSYAGYPWEGIMPAPLVPECNDSTGICEVNVDGSSLPRKIARSTGAFVIQTRQRPAKHVTEAEAVARLMIQGTFGMTRAGIDGVLDEFGVGASNGGQNSNDRDASAAVAWFAAEVAKPPSFLRQRYRLNTNPRMFPDGDYSLGEEYGRCDVGSRWHLYAFQLWDRGKHIDMKAVAGGVFQLFVDGVLRTELPTFLSYTWTANHEDVQFYICGVEETSDPSAVTAIYMYPTSDTGASCSSYNYVSKGHKGVNPLINFAVPNGDSTQVYGAGQVELGAVKSLQQGIYYVKSRSSGAGCIEPGVQSGVSFMGITDAESGAVTYMKFESRMKFVENTVASPAAVESYAAGSRFPLEKRSRSVHHDNGVCPLTSKTFINSDNCVQRSNNICNPLVFATGTMVKLDAEMIRKFYIVSQKYVYVVKGLRLLESDQTKFPRSPCRPGYIDGIRTPEGRARFIRTEGSCPSDSIRLPSDGTEVVILAALQNETGPNSDDIRDIKAWEFTEANGGICSTSSDAIGASVDLDGDCWTQAHPHEQNVYDCTAWVMNHGGNDDARNAGHQNPIAKWAINGNHVLHFPSWHGQSRWDYANLFWDNANFRLMGKYGEEVDFSTLPSRVQTKAMAQELGGPALVDHQMTFESCGSRGEVQNDPSRGHAYLFGKYTFAKEQGLDRSYYYWDDGPSDLWENVVLRAPDQLRHRVAWALNQFITLSPQTHWEVEPAAVFYDILVSHAFGNFRALLREIAMNRMMAWYLTFEGNKKHNKGVYPDENFSREVMQLFTIGLYELNMDGTQKLDPETGEAIPTYDNHNIVSFARIWTGWGQQDPRSNAQIYGSGAEGGNFIDPLKLTPADRDTFPKISLDGGYLGDGYPLCKAQPARAFLLKGAHYHKTGSKSSLKLTYAEDATGAPIGTFSDESSGFGGTIREHFAPDPTSKLYEAICSADSTSGSCTFPTDVHLPATIPCSGNVECGADILHVVKVVQGDRYEFYKYVEPVCVDMQFFRGGKSMVYGSNRRRSGFKDQCADPTVATRAGVRCCKPMLKSALEYPTTTDGTVQVIMTEGTVSFSIWQERYYWLVIQPTVDTSYKAGASANDGPYALKFAGRDERLFVDNIYKWSYRGDGFIFEPGLGVTLADMEAFFNNTAGMEMIVTWWDETAPPAPFNAAESAAQCLYLAEPMTFATAQQRCAAVNGSICTAYDTGVLPVQSTAEDGSSADWLETCSGFQYDWSQTDCSWRINIHPDGPISVADTTDATGDWFQVHWATPEFSSTSRQTYPHPEDNNCGQDATPSFVKVGDRTSCSSTEDSVIGMVDTLQNCAASCSANGEWDWFTYGRNDSVPSNCNEGEGCECRCVMQSSTQKDRCSISESVTRNLYKFERRCKFLPDAGGSCLCDIEVETTAVYADATVQPPSVAELRSALNMAAPPPSDFGAGIYTQCTTAACASQTDVIVHIKGTSESPSEFDVDTIFEIASAPLGRPGPKWSKYLLNRKSIVYVGPSRQGDDALFSFRNAPTFNPSQGVQNHENSPFNSEDFTEPRVRYETTALLDHLFEHPNTAPFVAYRLIQRLTTSNPSPRYVEVAATAFATGRYGGRTYSGVYGDLEATVAAIMLDREARASILDSDPNHGQLREPIVKIFHMMRAMDFRSDNDFEISLRDVYGKVGQEPFRPLTVFSFFAPDYSPEGAVMDAGLVAPEAMLISAPWTVGYLTGMAALASDGLDDDDGGFGSGSRNQGSMHFKPSNPLNVTSTVDELALILTAGRISENTRRVISAAYGNGLSSGCGWYNMSNAVATMGPNALTGSFGADAAIDDNHNNEYSQGCSTATATDQDVLDGNLPWWQVDLKRLVNVTHVKIMPRGAAQSQMIHGIDLEVDGVICNSDIRTDFDHISCGLVGQVVRIVKRSGDKTDLQLCDFRVGFKRYPIAPGIYAAPADEFSSCGSSEPVALREALTLFSIVPEYHTTGLNLDRHQMERVDLPVQESQNRPYKAVITTQLIGGVDSFNILVPLDGCTQATADGASREAFDLYGEYASIRGPSLRLATSELDAITPAQPHNQPCTRFGITKKLPIFKSLWDDGDLTFIANMGALVEPMNKHTRKERTAPPSIYGHRGMETHCLAVDAGNPEAKGVIGRMVNHMTQARNGETGHKAQMYSLQGATKILEGAPGSPVHLHKKSGVVRFPKFSQYAEDIANFSKYRIQSHFAEHYVQQLHDHLSQTEELGEKMDAELQTAFSGDLGLQYQQVAKAIRMDTQLLDMERAGFFTSLGGFDTHSAMDQDLKLEQVNSAITSLVADLKAQGLWDNVVIVFVSDFGRTLTGNSRGTDHGWGGNYFVMGGKVIGGQVLGKYPDRLDHVHSDENDGRGRMIPSTPWESMWNGVAEWYGVDEEGREAILPMMKNFEKSTIFSAAQLFEAHGPTPEPTPVPPTPEPTPVPPPISTRRRRRRDSDS